MSDLYEILAEPAVRDPALILALSGWVDAGAAGTGAAEFLAAGGTEIVRFDPDAVFEYRSNRPVVRFRDGRMESIEWPELVVQHRRRGERDLLVMVGNEPDLRWKAIGGAVADLMERFGAELILTVGAVPAAVPHTYPPPVMMTVSSEDLVGPDEVALGDDLDVPGAAVNVIADAAVRRGMATIGFWAQVPHYVNERYHAGILALVRRIALRLDLDVEAQDLIDKSSEQTAALNAIIATRPENEAHLRQLEKLAEEGRLASGDELASEIERFLRGGSGEPG
jgi:proteasome assembly chaperone (PAC2) family protein